MSYVPAVAQTDPAHGEAIPLELVPCPVCGGGNFSTMIEKFSLPLSRCRTCGLVAANPRAPQDAILKRYSGNYFWGEYLPALGVLDGQFDLDRFDGRYAGALNLLRTAAGCTGRLIEVGSGAGFFLKAAERAGWQASGVELSDEGVRFARDRLQVDVRQERAERLACPDGTFEAAVMFDVIEHLFDPRAVLARLARVLAPGGVLFMTTPNFDALSRFVLGPSWAVLSPLEHVYYFTERTLRRLLEATGYREIQFVRRRPDVGPVETMNYRYTHQPDGGRAKVYAGLVSALGSNGAGIVQALGRSDVLTCLARKGPAAGGE